LLALHDEAAAAVEVEIAVGNGGGAAGDFDGELEGVAGGVGVGGFGKVKELGEADEEGLRVGTLGSLGFGPIGDKLFDSAQWGHGGRLG
jgi:hypothetical protein